MLFGADDRTLEDKEVAEELEKILSDIGKKIPLEIRDWDDKKGFSQYFK